MKDAIVVGNGIMGATIARALTGKGLDVLVVDDKRPLCGTAPSGGHLRPSWFGGMKKADYEPAMELLDSVWGLKEEQFLLRPSAGLVHVTVYRVDTDVVVQNPCTVACVRAIKHLDNYPLVEFADGTEERCRLLVVAAGVWSSALLPELALTQKQGVSFRLQGVIPTPFIKPWAPYKQVVAHQQGPAEVWVGDGTAIIPQNWMEETVNKSLARCLTAAGPLPVLRSLTGLRPYCRVTGTDPCLLRKISPRCWVATGAGKMGTIAAGWAAWRLTNAL